MKRRKIEDNQKKDFKNNAEEYRKRGEKYDQPPVSEDEAQADFLETLRYLEENGIELYAYLSPRQVPRGRLREDPWVREQLLAREVPVLNLSWFDPVSGDPDAYYERGSTQRRRERLEDRGLTLADEQTIDYDDVVIAEERIGCRVE